MNTHRDVVVGVDDPAAVVDAAGRVYGIGGMRVVDTSIMPIIPLANTNLSDDARRAIGRGRMKPEIRGQQNGCSGQLSAGAERLRDIDEVLAAGSRVAEGSG